MRRVLSIVSGLVALLAAACAAAPGAPGAAAGGVRAHVRRVVDGDTIVVVLEGRRERVRLIGIDTPETVKPNTPIQCYGPEASAAAKGILQGEDVTLVYDRERRDRFGRTLAYVYRARDGLFVDLDLVTRGFARALSIAPDTAHASEFQAAEREARAAGRGLWGACRD